MKISAPIDLNIDDDMLEYVYNQTFILNGKETYKIDKYILNKAMQLKTINGLIALMRAVGFTPYSNYLLELKFL